MSAGALRPTEFVPTAEAAYIADVAPRSIHRVVDENILPDSCVRTEEAREIARLGAALAGFYFHTEGILAAEARRTIIHRVVERLCRRPDWHDLLALAVEPPRTAEWRVVLAKFDFDILPYVTDAMERIKAAVRAEELVTSDEEILSGTPVFEGTRVPIDVVLSSLDEGVDLDRLRSAYPFLTNDLVEAARVYAAVHPRRGRPKSLSERHPDLVAKNRIVLRRGKRA